jgi:hypothetical protein
MLAWRFCRRLRISKREDGPMDWGDATYRRLRLRRGLEDEGTVSV